MWVAILLSWTEKRQTTFMIWYYAPLKYLPLDEEDIPYLIKITILNKCSLYYSMIVLFEKTVSLIMARRMCLPVG